MDAFQLYRMLVFATVVEQGSLTAAAMALNISRSMVSQHLKKLEQRLNCRLLNRTTRNISLTDNGREFFRNCAELLQLAKQAEQQRAPAPAALFGTISIATTADIAQALLIPLLPRFQQQQPHLQLNLWLDLPLTELRLRQPDLLLCAEATATPSGGTALAQFTQHLVASPALLERYGNPLHPDRLGQYPYLSNGTELLPQLLALQGPVAEALQVRLTPIICCNQLLALRELVLQGMGIAVLPEYLLGEQLLKQQLHWLLPNYQLATVTLRSYLSCTEILPPRMQVLLDFLQQQLGRSAMNR